MHEHKTIMTMDGAYCPTCGKFLKDIPEKKEEPKSKKKDRDRDEIAAGRRQGPIRHKCLVSDV